MFWLDLSAYTPMHSRILFQITWSLLMNTHKMKIVFKILDIIETKQYIYNWSLRPHRLPEQHFKDSCFLYFDWNIMK